jgi:hypothetical protein
MGLMIEEVNGRDANVLLLLGEFFLKKLSMLHLLILCPYKYHSTFYWAKTIFYSSYISIFNISLPV